MQSIKYGVLGVLFVIVLAVTLLWASSARAAETRIDTMPMDMTFKSDLDAGVTACYDSDRQAPVFLVDYDIAGGIANAPTKQSNGECVGRINIERPTWNNASAGARNYIKAHERDHLLGWTHTEGRVPNHDGVRQDNGENAANYDDGPIRIGWSGPVY